ncbi:MAG: PAC2 family protein [Nitrososphaerota archaeon]|nr:PAC2 family protein [Nitrososphaerota archaeon]
MWIDYKEVGKPRLKDPAMVVAVSTSMPQYRALYSQAREMGSYLVEKMDNELLGTVRSSAFPPEVLIRGDGVSSLPECSFYRLRGKRDVVLFAGDVSPVDEQYEFAEFVLQKAQSMGVKELYSVGARWTENPLPPEADPQAGGFATDPAGVAKLKKHGVKILSDEPAPFFASMVVAMAKDVGVKGFKLSVDHGEPSPHTRSVIKLLDILRGMTGLDVDLTELRSKALPVAPPRQAGNSSIYH